MQSSTSSFTTASFDTQQTLHGANVTATLVDENITLTSGDPATSEVLASNFTDIVLADPLCGSRDAVNQLRFSFGTDMVDPLTVIQADIINPLFALDWAAYMTTYFIHNTSQPHVALTPPGPFGHAITLVGGFESVADLSYQINVTFVCNSNWNSYVSAPMSLTPSLTSLAFELRCVYHAATEMLCSVSDNVGVVSAKVVTMAAVVEVSYDGLDIVMVSGWTFTVPADPFCGTGTQLYDSMIVEHVPGVNPAVLDTAFLEINGTTHYADPALVNPLLAQDTSTTRSLFTNALVGDDFRLRYSGALAAGGEIAFQIGCA